MVHKVIFGLSKNFFKILCQNFSDLLNAVIHLKNQPYVLKLGRFDLKNYSQAACSSTIGLHSTFYEPQYSLLENIIAGVYSEDFKSCHVCKYLTMCEVHKAIRGNFNFYLCFA